MESQCQPHALQPGRVWQGIRQQETVLGDAEDELIDVIWL